MTDDETRELFHRVELRLERLDTKLDAVLEVGGKRRSYAQLFPLESVGRDPEAA